MTKTVYEDKIIEAEDLRPGMMLWLDEEPRLVVDVFPVDDYDEGGRRVRLVVRLSDSAFMLKPSAFCLIQVPVLSDPFVGL